MIILRTPFLKLGLRNRILTLIQAWSRRSMTCSYYVLNFMRRRLSKNQIGLVKSESSELLNFISCLG